MTDTPEDILRRLEEDELADVDEPEPEEEPTGEDPDGTVDTGVDEEADEEEDDSDYSNKDWTGVPVNLEIIASYHQHEPNQYNGTTFTVNIDRKSGPGISCGGRGGSCFGANSKEEAIEAIKQDALHEADWIISWNDDGVIRKINRPVKIKLTINGVKTDPYGNELLKFMEVAR